jgi:hypothetical protein
MLRLYQLATGCERNDRRRFGVEIQRAEEEFEPSVPRIKVLWGRRSSPFPVVRKSTSGGVCGPGLSVFCYFVATLVDTHYGWLPRVGCYRLMRLPGFAGKSSSAGYRERLSEKSRLPLQRSLTGHRNGAFRAVLTFVYWPNQRSKPRCDPFSDSFRVSILGNCGDIGYL